MTESIGTIHRGAPDRKIASDDKNKLMQNKATAGKADQIDKARRHRRNKGHKFVIVTCPADKTTVRCPILTGQDGRLITAKYNPLISLQPGVSPQTQKIILTATLPNSAAKINPATTPNNSPAPITITTTSQLGEVATLGAAGALYRILDNFGDIKVTKEGDTLQSYVYDPNDQPAAEFTSTKFNYLAFGSFGTYGWHGAGVPTTPLLYKDLPVMQINIAENTAEAGLTTTALLRNKHGGHGSVDGRDWRKKIIQWKEGDYVPEISPPPEPDVDIPTTDTPQPSEFAAANLAWLTAFASGDDWISIYDPNRWNKLHKKPTPTDDGNPEKQPPPPQPSPTSQFTASSSFRYGPYGSISCLASNGSNTFSIPSYNFQVSGLSASVEKALQSKTFWAGCAGVIGGIIIYYWWVPLLAL
ncbi:MAG: hypothetical protein JW841_02410 [Deltaproteobacteria bacterium]|nr:hypothetical protein [Deltaproteobacteria bacterium]